MRRNKKVAFGLLPMVLTLMAMLLVACGGGGGNVNSGTPTTATKADASKQIFVSPFTGLSDISTFDPALVQDLYSSAAVDMVYTGLVQLNDKGEAVDQLAASHQVAADGITWTFTLRDNLKFSDGTPITSQDVAYSIDRALQPATKSAFGPAYLGLVKDFDKLSAGKIKTIIGDSIMTPDAKTVVLIANKKAAYFLESLAYPVSYIVEKKLIAKYGTAFTDHLSEGGGDGPFMVSQYVRGKEIDFVPNPNYYGKPTSLKKVIFPFYKESATAYKAYQVGQVDTAPVPIADISAAKALPKGQFHQNPSLESFYFAMNYLVKPFDNIKVRQAFALALNKDVIAKNIWKGTVIPTNHIVPEGMPGYNANLIGPAGVKGTAGDQKLAKQLFDAGLKEDGMSLPLSITLTVSTGGSADLRNEFAAEQQMWQTALGPGLSIKIDDIDFNKLLVDTQAATNNPKGLGFWWLGWIADYPDPQDWTTLQFGNGATYNNMNYGQNNSADKATQQQIQQALAAADSSSSSDRISQYITAEQQLVNDVAWLTTYQGTAFGIRKACVVGVVPNALGLTPPDDWANIYISTDSNCANTSSYQ